MAISTALVVLLAGGTSAMAASALTDTMNATAAQYGVAGIAPAGGLLGNDTAANPSGNASVAPVAQAGAAGSPGSPKLPFTGYAAVPVLLIGLAFLVGGLLLRRSPRRLQQI